jgi:DNA (cytosine-5)-methyltransferase 3A
MNVLSLFDGMSCCQQALERAGHKVTTYYASEVDKYAIQVTQANYPNTIQLGDVRNVNGYELGHIDVLAGGSPCQSFSFAGKRKGMSTKCEIEIYTLEKYLELKSQNFEFEGQSYLFWEYMRILNELRTINPNTKFLLENVLMGEKWQKILTRAIGINPIMIKSALVSAQNRKRLYWTNIGAESDGLFGDLVCKIPQPKDKGILLKDILETDVPGKYFLSDAIVDYMKRHNNTDFDTDKKSTCLMSSYYKQDRDSKYIVHNTMPKSSKTGKGGTGPLSRNDGKTYCLDTGSTNAVEIILTSNDKRLKQTIQTNNLILGEIKALDIYNQSIHNRYPTLKDPKHNDRALFDGRRIRRLTPTECERLQTVTDGYTAHVSDTQRYKMLGNGWTVDVIAHIFKYL